MTVLLQRLPELHKYTFTFFSGAGIEKYTPAGAT